MNFKLYNNLTRKKEIFEPREKGRVSMYVCGITPYDECHLGHARASVVFDVLYRYLKFLGYQVEYVRNFTDVDDKIIQRANEKGVSFSEISEKFIASYKEQMKKLGVEAPTREPKATEHIQDMIDLTEQLIQRGLAYVSGADVFYRVRKFSDYGKLSHKKIDELESGARISVDEKKEDPLDFALWKGAKPGEPSWNSPWGAGRPGWHIECSAMSIKYLGKNFDIHGGGRDLQFPHHENEIAQSEGATGSSPFARYWIHNGFVNINSEKMSKSLGNFRSIPQILEKWDAEIIRYFLLSAHYASPIDFTEDALMQSQESLGRFYETLKRFAASEVGSDELEFDAQKIIVDSLNEDLNTAPLFAAIFDFVRTLNKFLDEGKKPTPSSKETILKKFQMIHQVLGIFGSSDYWERTQSRALQSHALSEDLIKQLLDERKQARLSKNFKRADEIRQELALQKIIIKDNPDGSTSWEVKA